MFHPFLYIKEESGWERRNPERRRGEIQREEEGVYIDIYIYVYGHRAHIATWGSHTNVAIIPKRVVDWNKEGCRLEWSIFNTG